MQATNSAGDGAWSDSEKDTPYTVPSKPSPTLASSDQTLTASWSAPSDGGSAITGYKVRYSVADANSWTTSNVLGSSTLSYAMASLTNGTEYEVQVQATNAAGDSGWSDSAKAKPCTVPSKPAKPTLTPGLQKLTASWSAPNNGGCDDITSYTVRYRATGTSTWSTGSSSTTSHEIGSLTEDTEYEVQVQATNPAGDSGYSDSATATVARFRTTFMTVGTVYFSLSGWTGKWWFKQTKPAGTCTDQGTTYTHSVSRPSPGTYTYAAFSDSTCSNKIGQTNVIVSS